MIAIISRNNKPPNTPATIRIGLKKSYKSASAFYMKF